MLMAERRAEEDLDEGEETSSNASEDEVLPKANATRS